MTALPDGLTQGTWNLDPAHSAVGFSVRHAGISKVRGTFEDVTASLEVGERLEDLTFTANIGIASVDTGSDDRDNHLRSADFFAAEAHPEMTFTTTSVDKNTITGDLTLHGVTQPVELDYDFEGAITDPFGVYRAGFTGSTSISRKEFGLTWNAALEAGGVLVGDQVKISIEAEFAAPAAA